LNLIFLHKRNTHVNRDSALVEDNALILNLKNASRGDAENAEENQDL